ncbi:MAG: PLP-dependent aminotransferase family protein, partial [Caulobacteraceae bacterium]|nr:PLP-dependent aminotransferase family protein [Caulobacteraceae bacterium]
CLWVELDAPIANALAEACERRGLRIAAGPRFGVGGAFERYVRFPFSASPDDMDVAVKIFAQTYRQMAPRRARSGARAESAPVY